MSVTRIATRYAKSILDLAIEQNKLERIKEDMATMHTATGNRDLYLMLKSPIIQHDKKNAVLDALFKDKLDVLTMAYLKLLTSKGREMYIPEIAAEFDAQYKELKQITSVRVVSAEPLDENVLSRLKEKILASGKTYGQIEIETAVNPEIIGGFILEFNDKRYDASVATKLAELKSEFKKNFYIKEF